MSLQLETAYERMCYEDRKKFWENLHVIFQWRGWDRPRPIQYDTPFNPRHVQVDALADLFAKNGLELEEFT